MSRPSKDPLKEFIRLASGNKIGPAALLNTYKETLLSDKTPELKLECEKIFAQYENGEIFPTKALSLIRPIAFNAAMQADLFAKEQEKLAKEAKAEVREELRIVKELAKEAEKAEKEALKEDKDPPKYTVTVFDERNEVISVEKEDNKGDVKMVPLVKTFHFYKEAEPWAARRVNEYPGSVAEIQAELQVDSNGNPLITIVNRVRALEILTPRKSSTVYKVKRPSGGLNLSGSNVTGTDHCHFSHGLNR